MRTDNNEIKNNEIKINREKSTKSKPDSLKRSIKSINL